MKPLKILLGNNTLSILAGSETWTRELAFQLKAMGHDVSCYAPELGIISDQLIEAGIPCYSDMYTSKIKPFSVVLEPAIDHKYDVIIANHCHIVEYLREQFPITPIISTIHGIIHEFEGQRAPEHPALNSGVNQFVAVSKEIQDMLKKEYNIDSTVIMNGFDIKKLSSLRSPSDQLKQFLVNTNYLGKDDEPIKVIRDAAKHFGAKVTAVGVNFANSIDVTKAIEDSDIVFGMGRSVLEGVAAGRLGIVQGRWGTGGPIAPSTVEEIGYFNFSGRSSKGVYYTLPELIDVIERYYNPENLEWSKSYMAKNHNIVNVAEEYIRIARELTGQLYGSRPSSNGGVASDTKPFKIATE